MNEFYRIWLCARLAVTLGLAWLALSACVAPPRYERVPVSEPLPVQSTQIVFYPANGQSVAQQDRDRYDCYQWSVSQTHFDPNQASLAQRQRVQVVPGTPEGQNVAAGAVTGAVLGAIVTRPRDAGIGAVIGAITGAAVGASADAAQAQQADRIQQRYDARDAQQAALLDAQINNYRRAMSACLEGRGYTVK